MLLSIVIVNYNTFQLTCNCIRSIKATTTVTHEIILVDNNSKECPARKFAEVFPKIKLVALKENVGFGRANNLGVAEASGKYVLLLNSDTVVNEKTLDETIGYLEANPSIDILGCKVLYANHTFQSTVVKDNRECEFLSGIKYLIKRNTLFVEARLFYINQRNQRKNHYKIFGDSNPSEQKLPSSPPPFEINYYEGKRIGSLVGVFLMLKRSIYIASKGFDPDFFMYYEEIEWFVNRLRGYNIVYYPNASILHYNRGSDLYNKMDLQFFVSQYLFWYKMGYPQFFCYFLYILFEIPSRVLVRLLFRKKKPIQEIPELVKAIPYFFKVLRYPNRYGG
ncbi:MAG: glycosyltransferase family 2 protein, partial [Bacteroidota bacterium]|nr:glycosyltransferase family 2 protein [Bacteroidota bacterium]